MKLTGRDPAVSGKLLGAAFPNGHVLPGPAQELLLTFILTNGRNAILFYSNTSFSCYASRAISGVKEQGNATSVKRFSKGQSGNTDRLLIPSAVFKASASRKHKYLKAVRVTHSYYETLH